MLIQVFLLIVIVFALTRVLLRMKSHELRPWESLFWVLFWILAGIAVLFPNTTVWIANSIGVGRGSDLVFYVSLVVLFYLVFRIFVRMERIERTITSLVQKQALAQPHQEKKTDKEV